MVETDVKLEELAEQPAVTVRGEVAMGELSGFFERAFERPIRPPGAR